MPKLACPITNAAAIPATGALCVFGKISTRLAPASATYRLLAGSTAIPCGAASVCAETCVGRTAVVMPGWPNTRTAAAPLPAPAGNSSTRLLPLSATNRSPFGPTATPLGLFSEVAFTAADSALVKSA